VIASAADRDLLARNLLFVTTPALWPTWPFLPLVRRTSGQEELGLLFDAMGTSSRTGYSATVFRCCLFMLPPTFEEFLDLPKEVFDSADELLNAGWRVD
jgi:hypothetical protein